MRTTLEIEDDVLQAAKELARKQGTSAGRELSALARLGLSSRNRSIDRAPKRLRGGVPVLPSRGEIVTLEQVQDLMDEEGI